MTMFSNDFKYFTLISCLSPLTELVNAHISGDVPTSPPCFGSAISFTAAENKKN